MFPKYLKLVTKKQHKSVSSHQNLLIKIALIPNLSLRCHVVQFWCKISRSTCVARTQEGHTLHNGYSGNVREYLRQCFRGQKSSAGDIALSWRLILNYFLSLLPNFGDGFKNVWNLENIQHQDWWNFSIFSKYWWLLVHSFQTSLQWETETKNLHYSVTGYD